MKVRKINLIIIYMDMSVEYHSLTIETFYFEFSPCVIAKHEAAKSGEQRQYPYMKVLFQADSPATEGPLHDHHVCKARGVA